MKYTNRPYSNFIKCRTRLIRLVGCQGIVFFLSRAKTPDIFRGIGDDEGARGVEVGPLSRAVDLDLWNV